MKSFILCLSLMFTTSLAHASDYEKSAGVVGAMWGTGAYVAQTFHANALRVYPTLSRNLLRLSLTGVALPLLVFRTMSPDLKPLFTMSTIYGMGASWFIHGYMTKNVGTWKVATLTGITASLFLAVPYLGFEVLQKSKKNPPLLKQVSDYFKD